MKKTISLFLTFLFTLFLSLPAYGETDADRFAISNPYENIRWESVKQYKTALHTHTNASDGDQTLKESLFWHLETGFDIVAVTDHGTADLSWAEGNPGNLIKPLFTILGRSRGTLEYLGNEGTFPGGVRYTYTAADSGDRYLTAGDRVILQLPFGTENNAISVNAHVNSWFACHTDNSVSTYRDALSAIERLGGLSVINHPGEYTKARYELHSSDAYRETNPVYAYYINKYAALLDTYSTCIGIDVNSKGDDRTRFDRILWDTLLTRFSANGENVFAIASSDAHQSDKIDTGFTLLLMPALSSDAAKSALASGEFFAASHCIGNYEELIEIADALNAYYGEETKTLLRVRSAIDAIGERIGGIENGRYRADDAIGATYSVLDEAGNTTVEVFPKVTDIRIDDTENTIEIRTEDALLVRFISEGKTVVTLPADGAKIDLDDYTDAIGNYIRAEIFGDGGILYTQAFLLNADKNAGTGKVTKGITELGILDFLLGEVNRWIHVVGRFFGNLF